MWNANKWAAGALVALSLTIIGCGNDRRTANVTGPTVALNVNDDDDDGKVYDQITPQLMRSAQDVKETNPTWSWTTTEPSLP